MLLTFDTNIIRDALEKGRPGHAQACQLLELDRMGICEIGIVSRLDADMPTGDVREKFETLHIARRTRIGTIAQWDISLWDADFWASKEEVAIYNSLFSLIFPDVVPDSRKNRSRVIDVGHLLGHLRGKRDIFVTRDGQILKKQEELLLQHTLRVMNAEDALAMCTRQ